MALRRITPPSTEPVTLDEAKLHCRVDVKDEDNLIASKIKAAREYCEDFQKRSYIQQTWELTLDNKHHQGVHSDFAYRGFPHHRLRAFNEIELPRPPLISVESFKYFDVNNTEYVVDPANYFVDTDSEPGRVIIVGAFPPVATLRPVNAVKVRYIAGIDPSEIANVSEKVRQSILLLVGFWYKNRETVMAERGVVPKELEFAVTSLLSIDRMVSMV